MPLTALCCIRWHPIFCRYFEFQVQDQLCVAGDQKENQSYNAISGLLSGDVFCQAHAAKNGGVQVTFGMGARPHAYR